MTRSLRRSTMCVGAVLSWAAPLWAQFPSAVVGFNGPPIDDEATSQEMFRIPEWSSTTANYVLANTPGTYDNNAAFRASGFGMEGAASLEVIFRWVDSSDPDSWVRLTTFGGPEIPNPGLDTSGKIRFNILNRSELFQGQVGLCVGIRETGEIVPQLSDGGTGGDIEWVGVDPTLNGIIAGADMIVDTTAHANDVQVYPPGTDIGTSGLNLPTGTAVIEPGGDGVLDTAATANDDQFRFGYFIAANGTRTPIPALILPVENNHQEFEIDLATGDITHSWDHDNNAGTPYQTTIIDGGITGLTGNGVLDAANDRGTLEHLALVNVAADTAVIIDVGIDELQFEATVPDPVPPPTVVWPIIAGDTEVTVTDLIATVDRVTLLVNGSELMFTTNGLPAAEVVFNIGSALTGDVYTATQRNSQSGVTSDPSPGVAVLPEPPLYTFSILLDEGGTGSCTFDSPGWEWVGVTSVQTGAVWTPQGGPVFANDAVWQAVDLPLDDDGLVLASLGGDGQLLPSPSGFYTIDSVWFTMANAPTTGPWEVFIDAVQLIDSGGAVSETVLAMEDGVNRLPFARGQSPDAPTSSTLSELTAYDGLASHRLEWTYDGIDPDSIGILQRVGSSCGTSALIDDSSTAIRFHMLLRGQPTNPGVALPQMVGPIVVGSQDTVRVINDPGAVAVQLLVNGDPEGAPVGPTGPETDFTGLSLAPGDSVSATQDLGAPGVSDPAYPRVVSAGPLPPAIATPLLPGATSVTVEGVYAAPFATASVVNVLVNGAPAGSAGGGTETVVVPTGELQPGDAVSATQMVNGVSSGESTPAIVADSTMISAYELSPTLAGLTRAISTDDLINGQLGVLENGDVDLANGVTAWNIDSGSACLEMLNTEPSPGFHPATPPNGLADLTDGVEGSTIEAVLADFNRASLVVRYDFPAPVYIEEIVVFAANADPNAPNNGRLFQHYDVWISTDDMLTFEPLALTVTSGGFGYLNLDDDRATFTHLYDGLSNVLAQGVTNIRFVFYAVSNTAGRFQDPWQGNFNEDAAYQTACPVEEIQDVDGYRKAFEAPILKEIDVFGFRPGDFDGDGDVDLDDHLGFFNCMTGPAPTGPPGAGCEVFDLAPRDGDVDLSDFAEFQRLSGQAF
ncbi:MAG: hypothetical protein GY778_06580 [bacterium]|nr:hypothetical protein [bacterium]